MSAAALRFVKFSCVGVIGFVCDAGVFQALVSLAAMSPYLAKIVSYVAAATVTWWLNRHFTFDAARMPASAQWARFLAVNAVGAVVNYAVFAGVLSNVAFAARYPLLAVAAGALVGLIFNFMLSQKFVFQRTPGGAPAQDPRTIF